MTNKLGRFLKQPFPLEQPTIQLVISIVGAGLFVSLFLVIFQPFNTSDYVREGRTWILWGYGAVTILALLFDIFVLPRFFPGIFRESKWNIFKGICFQFWHILSIGTANMLYAHFIGGRVLTYASILDFLVTAFLIGFFPIIISVLSFYIYLLEKYTESSFILTERILSEELGGQKPEEPFRTIVLSSDSGKEKLKLNLRSLLFIRSIENYVEIHWTDQGQIKTRLLRSTLKRIDEDFKAYPFLFRCHRTYLVNVKNIARVTGNSRGYRLGFKGVDYLIPVSRHNSKKLIQLLT
jgi:DNA-binding LytR/AlgR family response regulator